MSTSKNPVASSAKLFAPIQEPRITAFSHKAIQDFLNEREVKEETISAQPGLKAVSWKSCFPASFLRSLVTACIFGVEVSDVSTLSDASIKANLTSLSSTSRSISSDGAAVGVKKNTRLDATEPDARMRTMLLSASYIEFCEERGWNFVKEAPKVAISHIISVLQPPQLKSRIQDAIKMEESQLEDKCFELMDFLAEKSVTYEDVLPLRIYGASTRGSDSNQIKEEKDVRKIFFRQSSTKDRNPNLPLST
ncbi:unnamed protein product [Agarophyton chilense]